MLTIGVMQIGSEYRHKTITGTLLSVPRRARAMAAKVVALLGLGVLYGLLSVVVSVGVGALVLQLRGADPFPSTEVVRTVALTLLVLALWALIGLGVGILIPNQVAALLIGVGVAWIVEPILGVALRTTEVGREGIAPYLPSAATNAVLRTVESPGEVRLEWWLGALVLAAYALVLSGIGTWRVVRQDIS
jgi:ABC-type transport system involved in multi-copper enzyme maturation permease subunit